MGKKWDATGIAYSVPLWTEVLRVLKPGGHLLAFGGTRTYHRMACAIEDAGFEIRDSLHWMYGTGFPKSLDVSKAIDAVALTGKSSYSAMADVEDSKLTDRVIHDAIVGGMREETGIAYGSEDSRQGKWRHGERRNEKTLAVTDAAKQWSGWGTALKPACEPIVMARKPLIGTVAANVLAHGTGGLNIDACRIEGAKRHPGNYQDNADPHATVRFIGSSDRSQFDATQGRWPANVLLDEEAARMLDEQSGIHATRPAKATLRGEASGSGIGTRHGIYQKGVGGTATTAYVDTGGASRFFYVAKASRAERDLGCEHLAPKSAGEATDREDGSEGLSSPRAGAGRTGGVRNVHPTVKPVTLMRYLVRMVTPPGGLVLDPFTGSGTTGMAAMHEGMKFVGVEREEEYIALARARIDKIHTASAPEMPQPQSNRV
jgi:site-specific DNA-methyltransferase (adenine-specific)